MWVFEGRERKNDFEWSLVLCVEIQRQRFEIVELIKCWRSLRHPPSLSHVTSKAPFLLRLCVNPSSVQSLVACQ